MLLVRFSKLRFCEMNSPHSASEKRTNKPILGGLMVLLTVSPNPTSKNQSLSLSLSNQFYPTKSEGPRHMDNISKKLDHGKALRDDIPKKIKRALPVKLRPPPPSPKQARWSFFSGRQKRHLARIIKSNSD